MDEDKSNNKRWLITVLLVLLPAVLIGAWLYVHGLRADARRGLRVAQAQALGVLAVQRYQARVPATADWVGTSVRLSTGDLLYFSELRGAWRVHPRCRPTSGQGYPQGECILPEAERRAGRRGLLLPGTRSGALLWRTDRMSEGAYVVVPGGEPIEVPKGGRLQLRINDDHLPDNDGQVTLTFVHSAG